MRWAWQTLAGVFFRPRVVLQEWRAREPAVWPLLLGFTVPMIVLSVLAVGGAHAVIPSGFPPETRPDPVGFAVYSALTQLVGVLGLAAAAHYLCDLFQGRSDFHRALAAVSVALIPAWLGNVVAALPWPWGPHLALVCVAYSFVLLYGAFVVVLDMRPGNRVGHYAASLGAGALVIFAFGWQAVSLIPGAAPATRLGTTWLI